MEIEVERFAGTAEKFVGDCESASTRVKSS
jgi:hypothetical protein